MPAVQTVLGPVDPSELGPTMSHVHLTLDIRCWFAEPEDPELRALAESPITLENLGRVRRNGLLVKANLVQDDVGLAVREAGAYRRAGGRALVCMELPGIGRDVGALARISRETGLHVVASTGFYTMASHPPEVAARDVDALADAMAGELRDGIAGSGVRAGNIGEIGCSGPPELPFLPEEEKVLRAAARAQARTGASLTIHPNAGVHNPLREPADHLDAYLDVLEAEGADLARVYMSHMGFFPVATARRVLDRGLGYVSYDHFGHEEYYEGAGPGRSFPRDRDELARVVALLEAGLAERVLIGCEIGWKTAYRAYGGWGYGHVLEHVIPWLRDCGASDAEIHTITVENPARLHAW